MARSPLLKSTRIWVYFMIYLTCLLQYAVRFAINMSIVCMVVPQQLQHNTTELRHNNSELQQEDTLINGTTTLLEINSQCDTSSLASKDFGYEGEFYWSRSEVGYILGSFFYGYVPIQIFGGWLADKFGIRHVLGSGMLIGGVLSLLTPLAARLHYGVLIALRIVMGLSMGVMFPCQQSMIMKWVPDNERSTYIGWTYSGISTGIILSFLLSGYLCPYSWTYVFYILGALIMVWYAVFMYVVYSHPDDHPRITEQERMYIRETNKRMSSGSSTTKVIVPWISIFTSPAVIGLCITQFMFNYAVYTVYTGIPLYMQEVLYFNIKSNGLLSSLPHLLQMFFGTTIGIMVDLVHRKLIKSKLLLRRLMQTIAMVFGAIFLMVEGFTTCEQRTLAITIFCLFFFFMVFARGGHSCSCSDIAPRFAGIVFGVMNLVGNFPGFLAPIAIGNLTPTGSQAEWQKIFFLSGGLILSGWLAFMFLVPVEEQAWAKGDFGTVVKRVSEEEENNQPLNENQKVVEI